MKKKTIKHVIYFGLGIACVPLIVSMALAISGFTVAAISSALFSILMKLGSATAISITLVLLAFGFPTLWFKLTRIGIRAARTTSIKILGTTNEEARSKRYLEEVWAALWGLVSIVTILHVFSYYFFEGLRPGPPEPGSPSLSAQAKYSIINAYKECAVQLARGENNGGLSYPSFTKPNVDNYVFYPENGSCLGDKAGNISARSNNDKLNPSFFINPQSGYKSCSYEGKGKEKHGCVDGGW